MAASDLAPIGTEFLVNTTTAGDIFNGNIGTLSDGGFAAVWVDYSTGGIRLQRFAADGDKSGQEFEVATAADGRTWAPAVQGLADGSFVVVWRVDREISQFLFDAEIKAQLFDADGNAVGNVIAVNTTTADGQYAPQVSALGNGGFMVAWWSGDQVANLTDIRAQAFTANGAKQGVEIDVNGSSVGEQTYLDLATLGDGNVVVVWEDWGASIDTGEGEVVARILGPDGAAVSSPITVNGISAGRQWDHRVAALDGGGFVVAWHNADSEEGEGGGVMAQRFDASGQKVGAEIIVRAGGSEPAIAGLADGGFIVSFSEYASTSTDSDPPSVLAQVFDSNGAAVGAVFQINTQTALSQSGSDLVTLAGGDIAVIWEDRSGTLGDSDGSSLKGQLYDGPGGTTPDPDLHDLTDAVGDSATGGPGDDTFIVDDTDDSPVENAGEGTDTVQSSIAWTLGDNLEILELTGGANINGTGNAGANTVRGNTGANALNGGDGADTLQGGGGNDILSGGAGADTLLGGTGNDTYLVGIGDRITEYAGAGTDTVKSALAWTLAGNVENLLLIGTAAVNGTGNGGGNTLTGNGAANKLSGLGGNDVLVGAGGADVLNGGDGNDVLKGGVGNDILTGGLGVDSFVFDTALAAASNSDKITDFKSGIDRIRLDDDVFTTLVGGAPLGGPQFKAGAGLTAAQDDNDRIIYNTETGALFYDRDGVGGVGAVKFAVLGSTTHPTLTAADFVIIT